MPSRIVTMLSLQDISPLWNINILEKKRPKVLILPVDPALREIKNSVYTQHAHGHLYINYLSFHYNFIVKSGHNADLYFLPLTTKTEKTYGQWWEYVDRQIQDLSKSKRYMINIVYI